MMSVMPRPRWGRTARARQGAWIWSMSMNAASKNKEATWLFLSWVTSKDTMIATHLAGNMNPVRASAWENPDVVAMVNSWGETPGQYSDVTATMAEVAAVRFPPHPELTRMLDRWAQAVQEVYFNGTDTRTALCEAQGRYRENVQLSIGDTGPRSIDRGRLGR